MPDAKFTYLIPSTGDERFLERCREQIEKYTPGVPVMVVRDKEWKAAWAELWEGCPTDVGVFIDDDCFLTADPLPTIEKVLSSEYDMAAVEEVIPYYKGGNIRFKPGYYQSSFMVLNIGKCKREKIDYEVDQALCDQTEGAHHEFHYGLSQRLKNIYKIPCALAGKWFMATTYGDFAIHLWYGSWKRRNVDDENHELLETRDMQVLAHYGRL
jgi:hypothetical protein